MPSDETSQLGRQLRNLMALRFVLLQKHRGPENEQVVDSLLTLYEMYVRAGRTRADIALMLSRDFAFNSARYATPRPAACAPFPALAPAPTEPRRHASCPLHHTQHDPPVTPSSPRREHVTSSKSVV